MEAFMNEHDVFLATGGRIHCYRKAGDAELHAQFDRKMRPAGEPLEIVFRGKRFWRRMSRLPHVLRFMDRLAARSAPVPEGVA